MTKEELNKLLDEFGGYWHGWEEASSSKDRSSCQEGMQDVAEKIWASMEHFSMPLTFDDLVSDHGKEVVKDWLKAMLD